MTLAELLKIRGNIEIIKIKADANVADAANMLTEHKIGALLVESSNGDIVGILSERDIISGMGPHGADLQGVLVSEIMTSDLIRCAPDDTVLQAMAMMTDRRVRHLPVMEEGNLVGFISVGDLVKCRISEVQLEAEAMRQYIAS